jgi:hypothetical protein
MRTIHSPFKKGEIKKRKKLNVGVQYFEPNFKLGRAQNIEPLRINPYKRSFYKIK